MRRASEGLNLGQKGLRILSHSRQFYQKNITSDEADRDPSSHPTQHSVDLHGTKKSHLRFKVVLEGGREGGGVIARYFA